MKIRNKILLYFSTSVIALTIISSIITYILFSEYREEEFQQRLKQQIKYTLGLISQYKELSEKLTSIMDEFSIDKFYNEKMLIFDHNKIIIYKSIDDLQIYSYKNLLNQLSPNNQWIETKEDKYDVIAMYIDYQDKHFYAISKAYDAFGFTKLDYLKSELITITTVISFIVLILTLFISKRITKPITSFAEQLGKIDISNGELSELNIKYNIFELNYLVDKFNLLVKRTNKAFAFQKQIAHHISHQLKTPVAVLLSELERILKSTSDSNLKKDIEDQIIKTKSLSEIIEILLEISKIESGKMVNKQKFRVDELLFDCITELNVIYPDFNFEINYQPKDFDDKILEINANLPLIKQAFQNILSNCVSYSDNSKAKIIFNYSDTYSLIIDIINSGIPITPDEKNLLFHHFFRGKNSRNKPGFGLGLVLTKKIFEIHSYSIVYSNTSQNLNIFKISIPLS